MIDEFRYCIGCKWEFDFTNCKNEHKKPSIRKHKDGSMFMGCCAWKKPKRNSHSQTKSN